MKSFLNPQECLHIIRPALTCWSAVLLSLLILASCASREPEKKPEPVPRPDEDAIHAFMVERGRRIVEIGGCTKCHTPKRQTAAGPIPVPGKYLSGYPEGEPLPELPYSEFGENKMEGIFYTTDGTIWVGRWGVSFAANITPDDETGIGGWTEENFRKTFRTGSHIGVGRALSPPMPFEVYSNLTSEDLRAVFLYLQTIEPVKNKVPPPIPPDDDLFKKEG
jgi:hypothetical protein